LPKDVQTFRIANPDFLALSMVRLFAFVLIITVITACNETVTDESPLLNQPPYATVSDSIRQSPKAADLYYRRGVLLYQGLHKDLALADLRTAWTLEPKEEFGLSLATALRQRSEDSVIHFLKGATIKLPQSIAIKIGLAKSYQKVGQLTESLKLTEEIIALHPAQLDALLLKAELLEAQDKSNEALQALETAYNYAPSDIDLANNLAFAYAEARHPKALTLSDSLIRMDASRKHAEPYYFKGLYYENTGNTDKAIQLFDEAVQHDYYFLDAHMEKGQVYYNKKSYAAALKSFQLAATITPTFADAYYWVAKCLEAQGNNDDARLNYQRAYELDKSMKEAKDAMERLK
jgi:Flp pilus assembly protein TadD